MAPTSTAPPVWDYWDSENGARSFHGREITLVEPPKQPPPDTTYRKDYPPHELHWHHKPPPNRLDRPVPEFGHTSSHRAQFQPWKLSSCTPVIPAYPDSKFNPKLSAVTTSRASYVAPELPPPNKGIQHREFKLRDDPLGTTTMRADYLAWKLPGGHVVRPDQSPKPVPFNGTTTTRADYKAPAELPPPREGVVNPPHIVPKFDGTTEYRAKYEPVKLPPGGYGAIGLQTATKAYKFGGVGGQFYEMIPQGAPAPQSANKTFTTVVDDQTTAAIVIVTKRLDQADGVVLGYFPLDGIKKSVVGIPRVDVSLKLTNEKTLHASATYIQGQKKKALAFTSSRRGPPLRAVTSTDHVPMEYR